MKRPFIHNVDVAAQEFFQILHQGRMVDE